MLKTHFADGTLRVCSYRNVVFAVWFAPPSGAQMRTLGQIQRDVRREQGVALGFFNIIPHTKLDSVAFSDEARSQGAQTFPDEDVICAAVHAVMLPGLQGTTTRMFINTMAWMSRHKRPTKVFGNVEDASTWLADTLTGLTGVRHTADELRARAVEAMGPVEA